MSTNNDITLQNLAEAANQQYTITEKRLAETADSVRMRLDDKTPGSLIVSLAYTSVWLFVFAFALYVVRGYINAVLFWMLLVTVLLLIVALYIDEAMSYAYYGKISTFEKNVSQLTSRIRIARSTLKINTEAFMDSQKSGWDYALDIGRSIPDEATFIETTMADMKSLKVMLLDSVKNILYWASLIIIAIVSFAILVPQAKAYMPSDNSVEMDESIIVVLSAVGVAITCVGEALLARWLWSMTGCKVTNVTLFALPAVTIIYLVVMCTIYFLISILIALFPIIVAAIAIVFLVLSTAGG